MRIYTCKDGDELDLICHREYGFSRGSTEAVMRLNPKLANSLPILPEGLEIILPNFEARESEVVRLWS